MMFRIYRSALASVFAGAVLVLAGAPTGHAWHRQHVASAHVSWSPNTGMLEIIHRLHGHDVEQALIMHGAPGNINLVDVPTQARAALYVEQRFSLAQAGGEAVVLETVGAEFLGDDIYIYQEAPLASAPTQLCASHTALFDIWVDQTNTVVIDFDRSVAGALKTLVFGVDDGEQSQCGVSGLAKNGSFPDGGQSR